MEHLLKVLCLYASRCIDTVGTIDVSGHEGDSDMAQVKARNAVPINLPRLVGTRGAAERLVRATVGDSTGVPIAVFGRDLVDASPSFTDELVVQLQERRASEVVLYPSPPEFIDQFSSAAGEHHLTSWRLATDSELRAL